jgi:hypothetical protein
MIIHVQYGFNTFAVSEKRDLLVSPYIENVLKYVSLDKLNYSIAIARIFFGRSSMI